MGAGAAFLAAALTPAEAQMLLRGAEVVPHAEHLSFAAVLTKSMRSDAFKKQVDATVPMMCEGSDNMESCKKYITQGLMCTSFMDTAKKMDASQVDGLANFITRCESIERQVPNLASVMHWVQKPESVFNLAVAKAQSDTGISLGKPLGTKMTALQELEAIGNGAGSMGDAPGAGDPEDADVPSDESLGLAPIGSGGL